MNIIYITPSRKVGKYEWRYMVYEALYFSFKPGKDEMTRFTRYQYNAFGIWRNETEHPRYDGNDGMYAGLPKRLYGIYKSNETAIQNALKQQEKL